MGLKPLSHKTMKSTWLYQSWGFSLRVDFAEVCVGFAIKRVHFLKLHVHFGINLVHYVSALKLLKKFHKLHTKFDLEIHRVNFMLPLCTLRGILIDIVLLHVHFISKFKHQVNVKPTRSTMKYREATWSQPVDHVTLNIQPECANWGEWSIQILSVFQLQKTHLAYQFFSFLTSFWSLPLYTL